ncbi:MAG: Gfo/Idh/MocA family oxidoreductase [Elusimicrobia bacterium]|nr:Gfo/Idh/MocA family oxidoreductase [Elusimicrobiota bacterium]
MKKNLNALVVGCGSIGKRHLKNLCKVKDIGRVYVQSSVPECLSGIDNNGKHIELVNNLHGLNIDIALICNETYKHVDTAIELAKMGVHLFIEKPVSHNLNKLGLLARTAKSHNSRIFVAYNLRFLGAIKFIKNAVDSDVLGKPCFAEIEVGQYLPLWRPHTDYRKRYSAVKAKGGGVALDLSHEVDYMRYIFGPPETKMILKKKVSDLQIDSDDLFEGLYGYKSGFTCRVHLDYIQKEKIRKIRIVGTCGELECDLVKGEIVIRKNGKTKTVADKKLFDVSLTYNDELRHFVAVSQGRANPLVTLNDGIEVLKLIEGKHMKS